MAHLLAVENLTPVIKEVSDNIVVSSPSNNRQVIEKSGRSWLLGWTNYVGSDLCN
jgi:hypothetical protein